MRLYSRSEWRSCRRQRRYRLALLVGMVALACGAMLAFGADPRAAWPGGWP